MGTNTGAPRHDCDLCPRLARFRSDPSTAPRHLGGPLPGPYLCAPVPPFGPAQAPMLIVGLAPGYHGANRTGIPFWGDGAGEVLYDALAAAGCAHLPAGPGPRTAARGPRLQQVRITNAVKCVPPKNRPTPAEVRTCGMAYLAAELAAPELRVVLTLGRLAFDATFRASGRRPPRFAHGLEQVLDRGDPRGQLRLVASYHFSRYNLNTGVLSTDQARTIVARAVALSGGVTDPPRG